MAAESNAPLDWAGDQLLEKNSEGTITPGEKAAVEQLVVEDQELLVANGRRLAEFSKGEAARPAAGAVPVMVWVHPRPGARVPI
jgi:hypothetical protein